MKIYRGTKEDKKAFVEDVLSPLMVQANTGWYGAKYVNVEGKGEYVYLYDKEGFKAITKKTKNKTASQGLPRSSSPKRFKGHKKVRIVHFYTKKHKKYINFPKGIYKSEK